MLPPSPSARKTNNDFDLDSGLPFNAWGGGLGPGGSREYDQEDVNAHLQYSYLLVVGYHAVFYVFTVRGLDFRFSHPFLLMTLTLHIVGWQMK